MPKQASFHYPFEGRPTHIQRQGPILGAVRLVADDDDVAAARIRINHSGSDADRLINAQVQNADELARLYGALALEERHTQRWAIASHLISLVGKKVDEAQQAALLEVAIDHVRQIVGDASPASFAYIGNFAAGAASEALLELLLWTLDHPAWERHDSGAAMVLWVARTNGHLE